MSSFFTTHRSSSRFRIKNALVALILETLNKEVLILFDVDLLKTDDISAVLHEFLQDEIFTILPIEGPGGSIAVHPIGRISFAEDIITHRRERLRGWRVTVMVVMVVREIRVDGDPVPL
jgi:hypothetical protein